MTHHRAKLAAHETRPSRKSCIPGAGPIRKPRCALDRDRDRRSSARRHAPAAPFNDAPAGALQFERYSAANGRPRDRQATAELVDATADPGVPRCLGAASFARTAWYWIAAGGDAAGHRRRGLRPHARRRRPRRVRAARRGDRPGDRGRPTRARAPGRAARTRRRSPPRAIALRVPAGRDVLRAGRPPRRPGPGGRRARAALARRAQAAGRAPAARRRRAPGHAHRGAPRRATYLALRAATITEEDPALPTCPSLGTVWRRHRARQLRPAARHRQRGVGEHAGRLPRPAARPPPTRSTASTARATARCRCASACKRAASRCGSASARAAPPAARARCCGSPTAPAPGVDGGPGGFDPDARAGPGGGLPDGVRPGRRRARPRSAGRGSAAVRRRARRRSAVVAPAPRARLVRVRCEADARGSRRRRLRASARDPAARPAVRPARDRAPRSRRAATGCASRRAPSAAAMAKVRTTVQGALAVSRSDAAGAARRRGAGRRRAAGALPRTRGRRSAGAPASASGASATASPRASRRDTAVTFWSRLRTDDPRSGARLIVARDEGLRRVVATRVVPTGSGVNGTLKARVGGLKPLHGVLLRLALRQRRLARRAGAHAAAARLRCSRCCSASPPASTTPTATSARTSTPPGRTSTSTCSWATTSTRSASRRSWRTRAGTASTPTTCAPTGASTSATAPTPRCASCTAATRRVHVWDDHEVENNYTDNRPAPTAMQRAAGYRAAFEWLPRTVFPRDRFRVFKRIALGRTADLFLLDERQYRTVDAGDRPVQLLGDAQLGWLARRAAALQGALEDRRQPGPDRPDGLRQRPARGLLGRLRRLARAAARRDRARRASATSCSSPATPTCSCSTRSRAIPRPSAATRRTRRRRSSTSRGSVTSPGPRGTEPDVQAAQPVDPPVQRRGRTATRSCGSTTRAMTTEYRRSDISRPDGLTLPFERFVQPSGQNTVIRETLPPT